MTRDDKIIKVHELYSPSAPIKSENIFKGRIEQLKKINEAVIEKGQHMVIFGERGVGKTSLANIIEMRYVGAITAKITCNHESTLDGLWKYIFKRIPIGYQYQQKIGFQSNDNSNETSKILVTISDLIDQNKQLNIDDITAYLELLAKVDGNILLIFDEFDQISEKTIINSFANIIKFLSDNIRNVTILIVGIGSSVIDLIGEHQSIERCIRQIFLGVMTDVELSEIVSFATESLGMTIKEKPMNKIVEYSSGFPHYTHLLGKYSTLEAIENNDNIINVKYFNKAMEDAIENVNESIKNLYKKAILSTKEGTLFKDVLIACAMVKADEHSTFRATDVENYLKEKMGYDKSVQAFQYHLGKFCSSERGSVLKKIVVAKSRTRYRFENPLFKAFVRLKYHNEHPISDN